MNPQYRRYADRPPSITSSVPVTNADSSADTLQVESTNGVAATVRLLGGQGNDTFKVLKSSGSQSISSIKGQILVSPTGIDDPAAGDHLRHRTTPNGHILGRAVQSRYLDLVASHERLAPAS